MTCYILLDTMLRNPSWLLRGQLDAKYMSSLLNYVFHVWSIKPLHDLAQLIHEVAPRENVQRKNRHVLQFVPSFELIKCLV